MTPFRWMVIGRVRLIVALGMALACLLGVSPAARLAAADNTGQGAGAPPCPGAAPAANWLCINGGWVPPDHPLVTGITPISAPSQVSAPAAPPPPTTSAACSIPSPVPGWVCVNDGWVPADHPLAVGVTPVSVPPQVSGPTAPPPTTSAACSIPSPVPGWVCVNDGWVPADHPLAGGAVTPPVPPIPAPTAPAACDFPQPAPGWVCAYGEWLPADYFGIPTPDTPDPSGTLVPFSVIATTFLSGLQTSDRVVVRDQAAFEAVWTLIFASRSVVESPPVIDFAQEMVIVVSQGVRPSGGHRIDVEQITAGATALQVVVRSTSPGAYCAVTAALTWPTQVVRLPRFDGDVLFFEESSVFSCE